mmetsp:Transcript_12432/g.16603  ORF Transcript_12432/g.16603 Transcript_12432/m.16603 type:complete len:105 (+) Transcript_12432:112-426(+)
MICTLCNYVTFQCTCHVQTHIFLYHSFLGGGNSSKGQSKTNNYILPREIFTPAITPLPNKTAPAIKNNNESCAVPPVEADTTPLSSSSPAPTLLLILCCNISFK